MAVEINYTSDSFIDEILSKLNGNNQKTNTKKDFSYEAFLFPSKKEQSILNKSNVTNNSSQLSSFLDYYEDDGSSSYVCVICKIAFGSALEEKKHLCKCHDYVMCSKCSQTFPKQYSYDRHWQSVHETVTCAECAQVIVGKCNIRQHFLTYHQKQIPFVSVCSKCSYCFASPSQLAVHFKNCHFASKKDEVFEPMDEIMLRSSQRNTSRNGRGLQSGFYQEQHMYMTPRQNAPLGRSGRRHYV